MRRIFLLLCALMVIPAFTIESQDTEYKPPRKHTHGSIRLALRADLTVYQGGAVDADGNVVITVKDKLLKWNGEEIKTLDDFCRSLYGTKPNEIVEIEIATPGDGEKRLVKTVKVKLGDARESYKELYTHLDKRKRVSAWSNVRELPNSMLLISHHKLEKEWDHLVAAHEREIDLWDSYENLSSTDLLLTKPWAAHNWIRRASDGLANSRLRVPDFEALNYGVMSLRDSDTRRQQLDPPTKDDDSSGYTLALATALNELIPKVEPASGTSAEGWAEIRKQVAEFEFNWRSEPGFARSAQTVNEMRSLRLDFGTMIHGLIHLDNLRSISILAGAKLPNGSSPKNFDLSEFVEGDAVCFHTSRGLIAVGGPEKNVWKGGPGMPVLIVDQGGDDEYIDCATTDGDQKLSIVIDCDGDDHYRSTKKWGVASGMLGFAVIEDRKGDDTYECGDWGIGTAFGGIGLLIDREGNDRYLGGTNSIGCAAYGVGGVIDVEGNDLYDSHVYSVGCGQPGGVGFVLDHSGDDRYKCNGSQPSPYGTEGEWMGGGIGCGFGWRTLACGGIGLVVDVKGNDIYDAGEFGLACGYFMAIGAVRDMDGDDIYHSSRYGLAAAAHAAVGVFMDDKGNDVYEGKTAASIGGTWDIVTGYFYDGAGDDHYRCDGLGLGACAQNGFAIFWDADGNDTYAGKGSTLGHAGKAEYGGGRLAKNFGIFMDTGGGKDSYPRDNRKNNTEVLTGEYGIFVDD